MAEKNRKAQNNMLIQGSVFTLTGFCLWKTVDLLQLLLFRQTGAVYAVSSGIFTFAGLFAAFGAVNGIYEAASAFYKSGDYRGFSKYRYRMTAYILAAGFVISLFLILISDHAAAFIMNGFGEETAVQLSRALCLSAPGFFVLLLTASEAAFSKASGHTKVIRAAELFTAIAAFAVILISCIFVKESSNAALIVSSLLWLSLIAGCGVYALAGSLQEKVKIKNITAGDTGRTGRKKADLFDLINGFLFALPYLLSPVFVLRLLSCSDIQGQTVSDFMNTAYYYGNIYGGMAAGLCLCASSGMIWTAASFRKVKDQRKVSGYLEKSVLAALFVILPAVFFISAHTSFFCGTAFVDGINVMGFAAVQAGLDAFMLVVFILMISLGRKKDCAVYLLISVSGRCLAYFLLMKFKGLEVLQAGGWIGDMLFIYLGLISLQNRYECRLKYMAVRAALIIYACLCMNGVFAAADLLSSLLPLAGVLKNIYSAVSMAAGIGLYFAVCKVLNVVSAIFRKA